MENNTYLLDSNTAQEMIRLAMQGKAITRVLGLLPPTLDLATLASEEKALPLLDIGSGPGDWSLDMAAKYGSQVEIIGIDISKRMVDYANQEAELRETPNVVFQCMNALNLPLPFPDAHFALINMRVCVGFIPRDQWPLLFHECKRLLIPGGLLISTEGEGGITTYKNPATAQVHQWIAQVLWLKGLGFWDGKGTFHGTHLMQPRFFAASGFQQTQRFLFVMDASDTRENSVILLQQIEPLVLQLGVPQAVYDDVSERYQWEMQSPDFVEATYFQVMVGQKPYESEP